MNYLLIFGLVASVYAAPHYHQHFEPPPLFPEHGHHELAHQQGYSNSDGYFDTNKFWTDFSKDMRERIDMIADITRNVSTSLSTSLSQEGVEGNEYIITIPLSGREEKDITVKVREGLLTIQAQHSERNFLYTTHLPNTVNTVTGTWTYEKGVLKIVFPLKKGVETTNVESVTVLSMDFTTKQLQDADVGLNRVDHDTEVLTNGMKTTAL